MDYDTFSYNGPLGGINSASTNAVDFLNGHDSTVTVAKLKELVDELNEMVDHNPPTRDDVCPDDSISRPLAELINGL